MSNQYTALPVEQRFWGRVVAGPNECLLWVGALNSQGYGNFRADGRNGGAHRWAYEHVLGPVPAGHRFVYGDFGRCGQVLESSLYCAKPPGASCHEPGAGSP